MARTAQQFVEDRIANFGKGNLEALVADYAEKAVIITPMGIMRGRDQVRPMIQGFLAEFAAPGTSFEVLSKVAEGKIAHFTWKAETAKNTYGFAAEIYVLEEGKAVYHVLAATITPK